MHTVPKLSAEYVWSHAQQIFRPDPGSKTPSQWQHDRDGYGRADYYDVGSIRWVRMRAIPMQIDRKEESVRPDAGEVMKIILQLSGRTIVRQRGREVLISPGEMTIFNGSIPYSILNLERVEQRGMTFPAHELSNSKLDIDKLILQKFNVNEGNCRYLGNVLETALDTLSDYGEHTAADLEGVTMHSLRLALIEQSGHGIRLQRSELIRARVKMYINRRLSDPALSVDTLALAMNCSKSYLHKVFGESEQTVCQYILNQRLEKCVADLQDAQTTAFSIAQIAFCWGFSSLSHFGKVFSKRYGMAPSQFRQVSTER